MDDVLTAAKAKQDEAVTFLRELVECESPSDDAQAIERFTGLVASRISDLGRVEMVAGTPPFGPHLLCDFHLDGSAEEGQILLLGHSDTVYPSGTLAQMPCIERDGRLWGPGVFDMKAGIIIFVYAVRVLRQLSIPVRRRVLLQLNSDEEIGSPSSRALTEKNAAESAAVLVAEPSAGLEGKAKTARKGVGTYKVRVQGRSAHAGLDFNAGASAILELARQINRISGFTDLDAGLTVNPGLIAGGSRTNVVAAEAVCDFDFRIQRTTDFAALDSKFHALQPFDSRCRLEITGGLNRPPLERTEAVAALFTKAQSIAAELGIMLGETSVGGGSDGNFTAGMGIPTLDGIGAVGEGAHSPGESILLDRLPDRVALLAGLIAAI